MALIKTEIIFMVYGQNGVGTTEKRILELTPQEFTACTSSSREKNENLKHWAKTMFPTSKEVKIITARKI